MSCMYRLKGVGERTDPCGTPLMKRLVVHGMYACLPIRY